MNKFFLGVLFALLVVYVVSPLDLAPGPIDDALAIFLFYAANKSKLGLGKVNKEHVDVIDTTGKEI
ncbi:MAG: hypothetical protein K6A23_13470 [Butyrivibrio sp.]|nr:hypothetical protein [Butyrivibrio sp.]